MILIGASGHAKVIIDSLQLSGESISCLVDANPEINELMGYSVIHDAKFTPGDEPLIFSIGSNEIRQKLAQHYQANFGRAIHPQTIIDESVALGEGTVVMAGVVVNRDTVVGKHAILNTSCSIDHDNELGDYVHISPNATLCGGIKIREGTHIGAGATIIPNISIGAWATVGAGAVVIEDVPDYATVVGNPARVIKTKYDKI